jgi:hypothetical protein
MSSRLYLSAEMDLSRIMDFDDAVRYIEGRIPVSAVNDIYRLILKGEASFDIDIRLFESRLSKYFYCLNVHDSTTVRGDMWALCKDESLKGYFMRSIKARNDGATKRRTAQCSNPRRFSDLPR